MTHLKKITIDNKDYLYEDEYNYFEGVVDHAEVRGNALLIIRHQLYLQVCNATTGKAVIKFRLSLSGGGGFCGDRFVFIDISSNEMYVYNVYTLKLIYRHKFEAFEEPSN